jgi:hypothetical protein
MLNLNDKPFFFPRVTLQLHHNHFKSVTSHILRKVLTYAA